MFRGFNVAIFDQGIQSISNFLLIVLVAKTVTIEEFGYFSLGMLVLFFLMNIQTALLTQPHNIQACKFKQKRIFNFYTEGMYSLLPALYIVYFVFFVALIYFANVHLNLLLLLFVFIRLYAEFKRRLWYTTGSLKKIIYLDSYIYLLPLTVLYICFFSECGLDSLDSVITILSIATLPYLIFEVFNLSRINEPTKKALFFIKKSKELLTWGTANIVISFAATRSIPFLLSWIVGVKDAAIYNAFFSIISVINPLFLAVTNYFTSKISSLDSQSKRRIAYYKLIKFLGPVLAVVILVIFNFHKEIMLFVFNAEYAENSYYLLWMSFSLILILAANLIQLDLRAKEKLNVIFYGFLVALVFVFTVGLMLINMYSLMGGVITFILLWFFVNGYWYLFDHG